MNTQLVVRRTTATSLPNTQGKHKGRRVNKREGDGDWSVSPLPLSRNSGSATMDFGSVPGKHFPDELTRISIHPAENTMSVSLIPRPFGPEINRAISVTSGFYGPCH